MSSIIYNWYTDQVEIIGGNNKSDPKLGSEKSGPEIGPDKR